MLRGCIWLGLYLLLWWFVWFVLCGLDCLVAVVCVCGMFAVLELFGCLVYGGCGIYLIWVDLLLVLARSLFCGLWWLNLWFGDLLLGVDNGGVVFCFRHMICLRGGCLVWGGLSFVRFNLDEVCLFGGGGSWFLAFIYAWLFGWMLMLLLGGFTTICFADCCYAALSVGLMLFCLVVCYNSWVLFAMPCGLFALFV